MKRIVKAISLMLLSFVMVLSMMPLQSLAAAFDPKTDYESLEARFWEDEKPPIGFYINASARYILETVPEPAMGTSSGEWSVMDLLRGKYTGYDYINYIPNNYFEDYLTRIEGYVTDKKGNLHRAKSTEWSRLILALSSLGYDIKNVAGYDFIEELSKSHKFSYRQGINGPIWEIIALNTGRYPLLPADPHNEDANTFGKMIDHILNLEINESNGGWALTGKNPDPDITGMALQALAPYYLDETLYKKTGATATYNEFAKSVERAIFVLSQIQKPNGGYHSVGALNSESTTQVIVALTALNMDPMSSNINLPRIGKISNFITEGAMQDGVWSNNMIDGLLTFWAPNSGAAKGSTPEVGGFKHVTTGYDGGGGSGTGVNGMATDQALYGLIAYDRFLKKEKPLYDMRDMTNGEYKTMKAKTHKVTYTHKRASDSSVEKLSPYALLTIPEKANVESWNTKADGTGSRYLPGEKLVMPEHDIILYAQTDVEGETGDVQGVQKVIDLITELPEANMLTREHEGEVLRAKALYEKLSSEDRLKVKNHNKLVVAEGRMNQILAQYDDELKVDNLIQTIDSLVAVEPLTVDYELAVGNARRAYNALTAAQRLKITNIRQLQNLEAKMAILVSQNNKEDDAYQGAIGEGEKTVDTVIRLIKALPSVDKLTLEGTIEVRKTRVYYDALTDAQKKTVTNRDKLFTLEKRLDELVKEALEKEDLEDDTDFDSYDEMVIVGKTLRIKSNKSAGAFKMAIPLTVLEFADKQKLAKLEITDERGVKIKMDLQELQQHLKQQKNIEAIHVEITQYNFDTGLFTLTLQTKDSKGYTRNIQTNKSYIQVTVPYRFFIDGKDLNKKVLLKKEDNGTKAVSHISNTKEVTIKVKEAGTYNFANPDVEFVDIDKISNKDEILYLANRQVIKGKPGGIYDPRAQITRSQFALMISRALGLTPSSKPSPFKDMRGKEAEGAVQALYEAGITNGTSPTTYNPGGKLTRQQAAMMMARILRYTEADIGSVKPNTNYKDVHKISKEALPDAGLLNSLDIMTGNLSREFMPASNLTRSQMAKILKRTLGVSEMM